MKENSLVVTNKSKAVDRQYNAPYVIKYLYALKTLFFRTVVNVPLIITIVGTKQLLHQPVSAALLVRSN